ncbi:MULTISPECIES: hypothetical protein [Meiothermus]|jgi:hypothetical protein|uniref:Uncharacterized protein n=1 Tax=Meiothermus ruber (strain ATCC 35948 / DSM 1279 / VKM B-1258 / 21) TaxID=504728 RepID=D3PMV8_MEIRD|nr:MULTISPECIES: hypothetical protein [Meiothermus]ADD27283.1 hypothetical protein Mrub_0508 [Meiothermus ruber DSM 1279]AGK03737.1 hypothetical protein K649_02165 [Meiothermus ruber DSM 1279]GIW28998.1 MAG: hypothetical protein KatS3mg070_2361 [Meiothermus sp.]
MQVADKVVLVTLYPDRPMSGAEAEEWAAGRLQAQLPLEAFEDGKPLPPVAVVQEGQTVGFLEGARLLTDTHAGLRLVGVAGRWEGQNVSGMINLDG